MVDGLLFYFYFYTKCNDNRHDEMINKNRWI